MTITDLLKDRLVKNRAMTTITLRIPGDVVELAKTIAAQRNFVGYEALFKAYISAGLRRDEAARYMSDSRSGTVAEGRQWLREGDDAKKG